MSLRNMWIPVTLLLVVSCVVCLGYRSETDAETTAAEPLVEAEKRIEAENYYEAILALKPCGLTQRDCPQILRKVLYQSTRTHRYL